MVGNFLARGGSQDQSIYAAALETYLVKEIALLEQRHMAKRDRLYGSKWKIDAEYSVLRNQIDRDAELGKSTAIVVPLNMASPDGIGEHGPRWAALYLRVEPKKRLRRTVRRKIASAPATYWVWAMLIPRIRQRR